MREKWNSKICLIYAVVFATGMLTSCTISIAMFSRMQYMVYRLEKVIGLKPCDNESFCLNTANASKFANMTEQDKQRWVQSSSAYIATAVSLVSGIIGLLTIIPLGFISDKYGRKVAISIAYTGFIIEVVLNALVMLLHWPLWILIVATLPTSLLGNGVTGILTQLYVCITDLTQRKAEVLARRLSIAPSDIQPGGSGRNRSTSILSARLPKTAATVPSSMASERLSLIAAFEGCMGITLSASTMITGPVIQKFGFGMCGWAILLLLAFGGICCFSVPNTKLLWQKDNEEGEELFDSENEREIGEEASGKKRKSALASIRKAFGFVTSPIILGQLTILLACLVANTDIPVLNLYFIGNPFAMTVTQVGIVLGLKGIGSAIVNGLFVIFNMFYLQPQIAMQKSAGTRAGRSGDISFEEDQGMAKAFRTEKMAQARRIMVIILSVTLGLMAISRMLYGLSGSLNEPTCFAILYIGLTLATIQFFGPLIRALLSSLAQSEDQGKLFALLGFSEAFGVFIGFTAIPALFASTVSIYTGFVFQFSAAVLILALLFSIANGVLILRKKKEA